MGLEDPPPPFSVDVSLGALGVTIRWAFRAIALQGSLSGPGGRFAIPPSDETIRSVMERCTVVEWGYMETSMGTCKYYIYISNIYIYICKCK